MSRDALIGILLGLTSVGACSGDDDGEASNNTGASGGLDAASDTTSESASGGSGGTAGADASFGGAAGDAGSAGAAGAAAAAGAGGTTTFDCSPAVGSPPPLKLTQVTNAISSPIVAEAPPGDTTRLFVGSVAGTIRVLLNASLTPDVFLNITDRVKVGGEQGLLGLAFHPGFQANGRFFVHYTANGVTAPLGYLVISEFTRSLANPNVAEATSEKVVLTQNDPHTNHNGGAMHFRDGMLFISLGDGGGGGDPLNNGQTLSVLFGKILRIDVDNPSGGLKYGIPAGNMSGPNVRPEIWSYGLRNPWRWSFDACTGDMYIGDVGQFAWEEVDVEPEPTGSGTNYGWRVMEGTHCYNPVTACDQSGKKMPAVEYSHTQGCSVTGGYVYRGSAIPGLRGWYVYSDYCSGRFWIFRHVGGVTQDLQEITSSINPGTAVTSVASFGQDGNGELYVLAFGGGSRVFRIDAQ